MISRRNISVCRIKLFSITRECKGTALVCRKPTVRFTYKDAFLSLRYACHKVSVAEFKILEQKAVVKKVEERKIPVKIIEAPVIPHEEISKEEIVPLPSYVPVAEAVTEEGTAPLPVRKQKVPLFSLGTLKELFKFATVSAMSFVVVLIGMNFSAYTQMASYWIMQWSGTTSEQSKHLEQLVGNRKKVEMLKVGDIGVPFLPQAGGSTPAVNLEVSPPDNRIVLPKIGKNIPVIEISDLNLVAQNWKGLEEDIQNGLKNGVIHYPGTALPGQVGNFFITGHSSYYFWEKSKYKDVFALLPEIDVGDRITVYYNQKKYVYEITDKQVVSPTNTEVLRQTNDKRITLMTCVPVGTDLNRLVLVGKQIN